jgi:hypothetical protein
MKEQKGCCQEGWRDSISRKLGSCPRCMRASLTLALASWVAVVVVAMLAGSAAVVAPAIGVAVAFTLLLVAHLIAFFLKSARTWRAVAAEDDAAEGYGTRRGFLVGATAFLAAVLFAPLSRLVSAVAQQSPPRAFCHAAPHWTINLTTPPITGCGQALGDQTAGQVALANFLDNVQKACAAAEPQEGKKGTCGQRKCNKVAETCGVRRPTGDDFKTLESRASVATDSCGAGGRVVFVSKTKAGKDVGFDCRCDCA